MKKIAILAIITILMQNMAFSFTVRDIEIINERVIPYSFSSKNKALEESLSIKGLSNVEIQRAYVDNGTIKAEKNNNYIDLEFDDGEYINDYKIVKKVKSLELNDAKALNNKIIITPDQKVDNIRSVSGDFESAKLLSNGDIEVTIKDSAEGVLGYDEDNLIKSTFTVNIDSKNLSRNVWSEEVNLPHEIQGKVKPKSGDTSNVRDIYMNKNKVKIMFDNGVPIENETTVKSGYTYFWIDRSENGTFKKYNPNSVYSTDINRITGLGKYIDEDEFSEIGLNVTNSAWKDYCGIEKDGIRYIYIFDENKGIPMSFDGNLVERDKIEFDGQELNSEKFTVKLSNAGVSYIPEGKLYSMGELVKNTYGWGETTPNQSNESTKMFFNELTGKLETYVKHFKFFYGPKEKKTFGGYYTYPYSCTFEYEHYEPITCYSGQIVYEYESNERINGYFYNGWIKISYYEDKKVNDYPPTMPFNVKYNSSNGDITWSPGKDDYTEANELEYEIEVFDGKWRVIEKKRFEILLINHYISYEEPKVRIRAIDDIGQASDWAYSTDSMIKLVGEVTPNIVEAGDSINLFANTKSFSKVEKVIAKNDEMQMYAELQKTQETQPDFFEMGYSIKENFSKDSTDYLSVEDGMAASGQKDSYELYKYIVSQKFDKGDVKFDLIEDKPIGKKGSLIFSNLNYSSIPKEMFRHNNKYWFASFNNSIKIKRKGSLTKEEIFITTKNEAKSSYINNKNVYIPTATIVINTFNYKSNGNPTYEYIDVDKSLISKPVCITWNTDIDDITTFNIYLGDKKVYTYNSDWNEIYAHVDNFKSVYMYKDMKNYSKATYGYISPSSTYSAKWNTIAFSLINKEDFPSFSWLGYRIGKNEYITSQYLEEYNANPNVKNNYRVLICDDCISKEAIKRYMDTLKNGNIAMTSQKDTAFGDDVIQHTSMFQALNITIPVATRPGKYDITFIATDEDGEMAEDKVTLIVKGEEDEENPTNEVIEEPNILKTSVEGEFLGRFFYKDGKGYLEELKKTEKNGDIGFICAGETLGFYLVCKNVDYIEMDFNGNDTIKTFDSLTKKFLEDMPAQNQEEIVDIEDEYKEFPKIIYPQYIADDEISIFKWTYVVPYRTIPTLESWSSLKTSILEEIDTSRLFDRRYQPYELIIYLNGDSEYSIKIPFDVFERWDTVLNRDITKYIINSQSKWEMRLDK